MGGGPCLPLGDSVLLWNNDVCQLLGEVVKLGKAVQLKVSVVEAVVADVIVDVGDLNQSEHSTNTKERKEKRRRTTRI